MLSYYALRSRPRAEDKVVSLYKPILESLGARLIFPRRELYIRRQGKRLKHLEPLFPGYLFLETESMNEELYKVILKTSGAVWFVKFEQQPNPLSARDVETLRRFLRFGEIIRPSLVTFDANQKIRILSGPLQGLEGSIVKVDRRKQRARVNVQFDENVFQIDLAFEVMEAVKS